MQHWINTLAADLSKARVVSLLNPTTPQPFPSILVGQNRSDQWFFHADGTIQGFSGAANYTLRVTLGDVNAAPFSGNYTLTCGETTPALDFDADASDVAAALNGLATVIAQGGVDVTGVFPSFLIAWRAVGVVTTLTATASLLVPDSGIGVNVLTTGTASVRQLTALTLRRNPISSSEAFIAITSPNNGWSGYLTTDTEGAYALLQHEGAAVGDYIQATTMIQAEVIDGSGNVVCYAQATILLRASNLDIAAIAATPMPNIPTLTSIVQNRTLTGIASVVADATKLCGIATANGAMPANSKILAAFGSNLQALFELVATTSSDANLLFAPFDYDAVTNAYKWRLRMVWIDGEPTLLNTDTNKRHQLSATGAANSVIVAVNQTGQSLPA